MTQYPVFQIFPSGIWVHNLSGQVIAQHRVYSKVSARACGLYGQKRIALNFKRLVPFADLALPPRNAHVYVVSFKNPNAKTFSDYFKPKAARQYAFYALRCKPIYFHVDVLRRYSKQGVPHATSDKIRPPASFFYSRAYPTAGFGFAF